MTPPPVPAELAQSASDAAPFVGFVEPAAAIERSHLIGTCVDACVAYVAFTEIAQANQGELSLRRLKGVGIAIRELTSAGIQVSIESLLPPLPQALGSQDVKALARLVTCIDQFWRANLCLADVSQAMSKILDACKDHDALATRVQIFHADCRRRPDDFNPLLFWTLVKESGRSSTTTKDNAAKALEPKTYEAHWRIKYLRSAPVAATDDTLSKYVARLESKDQTILSYAATLIACMPKSDVWVMAQVAGLKSWTTANRRVVLKELCLAPVRGCAQKRCAFFYNLTTR